MMTSTLVETVSINYEDFNDSFLTCGTCLCVYDSTDHAPKLLPCSHTVCRNCLERITAVHAQDTGTFRCPICRETIRFPAGGVMSFPPSFIVNQLLDLMAHQRRDVIPKCSNHTQEELLFCETCDRVFCTLCTGEAHNGRGASEHTVIPFSIAIKRMSEILLYKAHLCIKNLNNAYDNVSKELTRLETNVEKNIEGINRSFQDLITSVEKRRHELLQMLHKIKEAKCKSLREQLDMIQGEKDKVTSDCDGLQYQVEVRNITKKIGDLNEKLDATSTLSEPRENSFLRYEFKHNNAYKDFNTAVSTLGCIKISTTFPALTSAEVTKSVVHLQSSVVIRTVDYYGNPRMSGGDPVTADLRTETGEPVDTKIRDNDDGTYNIQFVPPRAGELKMRVRIFDRNIRDCPVTIDVTEHNNPVWKLGSHGVGKENFLQPVRVAVDRSKVYVLDTGNSRIKMLDSDGEYIGHVTSPALDGQSCTGLAVTPQGNIVVVNWRTKYISTITPDGDLVNKFTSESFLYPIDVAVNSRGDIIIADNGASKLFIFDACGKLIITFGTKGDKEGQLNLISSVGVGKCDEILVTDHRIQVFTKDGRYSRQIPEPKKGHYGGVCVDSAGYILATKTEKGKCLVSVFNSSGKLLFNIDSHEDKLRRPSGLAVTTDYQVYVVDLGNECVKKYRYK